MNVESILHWSLRRPRTWPMMIAGTVSLIILSAVWLGGRTSQQASTAYHVVRRGDFAVTILESGTVAARLFKAGAKNGKQSSPRRLTWPGAHSHVLPV